VASSDAANKKAMWAFICSLVGLVLCGIVLGIVAIVLAGQAEKQGANNGLAKPARIIGIIDIPLAILGGIWFASR
jgi:hypothetical protein